MKNTRRYDLSDRLTHFFRMLDLDDGSAPSLPDYWGGGNIAEHTKFSALFLLRCTLRHGWLWATWSVRNNVRTIYGPNPAICFTDMPTAAFLETSAERLRKKQKISTYAITFPKREMFGLGARPVIYGLSGSTAGIPAGKGGTPRIMPANLLPEQEQYRYVTYVPTGGRGAIDWTHEREWRWRVTNATMLSAYEAEIERLGVVSYVTDIPGLDLHSGCLTGMGVIVNSRSEARKILHDILSLVDRGIVPAGTYEYVLVADDILIPEQIRNPDSEANAIANASIDLDQFFTPSPERDSAIFSRVMTLIQDIEDTAGRPERGEPGGCWLWLVDPTHDVTRALIRSGRLVFNKDGKYLLPLFGFSQQRGLRRREEMTEALGKALHAEYGIEATYFSVLASIDPSAVPSYNGDFLDNRLFYNFWSDSL